MSRLLTRGAVAGEQRSTIGDSGLFEDRSADGCRLRRLWDEATLTPVDPWGEWDYWGCGQQESRLLLGKRMDTARDKLQKSPRCCVGWKGGRRTIYITFTAPASSGPFSKAPIHRHLSYRPHGRCPGHGELSRARWPGGRTQMHLPRRSPSLQ